MLAKLHTLLLLRCHRVALAPFATPKQHSSRLLKHDRFLSITAAAATAAEERTKARASTTTGISVRLIIGSTGQCRSAGNNKNMTRSRSCEGCESNGQIAAAAARNRRCYDASVAMLAQQNFHRLLHVR